MYKFRFNWGLLIATVVLFFYSYIAFNGSLYMSFVDGDVKVAALLTLLLVFIVCVCVYVMCRARATRWKNIGIPGQVVFGGIILLTFCVAGMPFTSFLNAAQSKDRINEEAHNVRLTAIQLDDSYNNYVNERVAAYEQVLSDNPSLLKKAGGKNNNTKTANLTTSLKNRISPEGLDAVQQERRNWLDGIEDMSIWNMHTPKNISYLSECVNSWVNEYSDLSSIIYDGEDAEAFSYLVFQEKLDELKADLGRVHYSIWSILVAIICSAFMLLPYFITPPFIGKKKYGDGVKNYK